MTPSLLYSLIENCLLAVALFMLFAYVASVSQGLRGIAIWGGGHLLYTFGCTLLDAASALLHTAGLEAPARLANNLGTLLACAGMVVLAWAVLQFTHQRELRRRELWWMFAGLLPPLLAQAASGSARTQAVALVEIVCLAVIARNLLRLRQPPEIVPAWIMIGCCVPLVLIYGMSALGWADGSRDLPEVWASLDLSLWFMLNFCMLMLASFRAAENQRLSAGLDPLTGALNRRGLDSALHEQSLPARRLAVLELDLDRFKAVNDQYGHAAGDRVLQAFAATVRECVRHEDLFARTGGEEFWVVAPDLGAEQARQLAERIRMQVAAMHLPASDLPAVTASIGVACTEGGSELDELMERADQALYAAKRAGRNRVVTDARSVH
ncbi:MAG: GGDEF domain-containing protein [Pseudoxanthomonas sp.]